MNRTLFNYHHSRLFWHRVGISFYAILLIIAGLLVVEVMHQWINVLWMPLKSDPLPFLAFIWIPPSWLHLEPIALFEGWRVTRDRYAIVSLTTITGAVILALLASAVIRFITTRLIQQNMAQGFLTLHDHLLYVQDETLGRSLNDALNSLIALRSPLMSLHLQRLEACIMLAVGLVGLIRSHWSLSAVSLIGVLTLVFILRHQLNFEDALKMRREQLQEQLKNVSQSLLQRWPAIQAHGAIEQEQASLRYALISLSKTLESCEKIGVLWSFISGVAWLMIWVVLSLLAFTLFQNTLANKIFFEMSILWVILSVVTFWLAHLYHDSAKAQRMVAILTPFDQYLKRAQRDRLREKCASKAQFEDHVATAHNHSSRAALLLQSVTLWDAPSQTRLGPLDFRILHGHHVLLIAPFAIEGDMVLSACAGLRKQHAGHIFLYDKLLAHIPQNQRADHIGLVSPQPLITGDTWIDNLSYGADGYAQSPEGKAHVMRLVRAMGLETILLQRALATPLDPERHSYLLEHVLKLREAVHQRLCESDLRDAIDLFSVERLNRYNTIGENILCGAPIGDTFSEHYLAEHPFMRAVLETEDLTGPLESLGREIIELTHEMFEGIAADHTLFRRFALIKPDERSTYAEIRARHLLGGSRSQNSVDKDRLIALSLRYQESRHRLGLMTPDLERRVLQARQRFAQLLPMSLKASIAFFKDGQICEAASFLDNILFGRVAQDVAGAESRVMHIVYDVLRDAQLMDDVLSMGLAASIKISGVAPSPHHLFVIDLIRTLLRKPSLIVIPDWGGSEAGGDSVHHLKLVMNALQHEMRDKTLLIHAREPLDDASFQQIVILEKGVFHYP